MREQPELSIEELDLPSVMHALADPSRLRMVAVLEGGAELSCAELGEQAGTARPSRRPRTMWQCCATPD